MSQVTVKQTFTCDIKLSNEELIGLACLLNSGVSISALAALNLQDLQKQIKDYSGTYTFSSITKV